MQIANNDCPREAEAYQRPVRGAGGAHRRVSCWVAKATRALAVLALLLPTACHSDKRITLAELTELEQQIAEVPAVPVEREQLALTDLHPYKVGLGDILTINMIGLLEDRYASTALQLRVHDDGRIVLPAVGAIEVAGLDLGEVEQAIIAAHVPDTVKDLSVYVELAGPESTTVVVQGAAGAPGLVKLNQNQRNPLYALALAGGFGVTASGNVRLKPIRPEREEIVYDLNDVNDIRRALLGPPLESGDVLVVEAADDSVVYVSGLVNIPGPIPLPPRKTLSLLRVIAASGGLIDFLQPEEATLWRRLADGRQVCARVNLAAIRDGEALDIALRAGDILDIPHTGETRFREWFAANIRLGPFGVTAVYDPVADYRARLLRDERNVNVGIGQSLMQTLVPGISDLLVPPVPAPNSP